MTMLASQITSLTVVYSIVYSGVIQRKHQSSASLAFVREIHRGPVNFPQKWPVTRKMFPFDDVIMRKNGSVTSLDPNSRLGPHKFSLHGTVGHHGNSMHCGHYSPSVNCCGQHSNAMIMELRNVITVIHTTLQLYIDFINCSWSVFHHSLEGRSS